MATPAAHGFRGFHREALQFLVDLSLNNERAWFQPRKSEFERLLKEPLEALCVALADRFEKRGLPMVADPKRSPFRIYRDTRFSKDKSPYKTNIGADFPWLEAAGADSAEPGAPHRASGGYFHLSATDTFVGGGMWHPEPAWLAGWRALVDREPERVHAAIEDPSFVKVHGTVQGDPLKRVPVGFAADHPEAELLKFRGVTFGRTLTDREIASPRLPDVITETFEAATPVFRLLAVL